MRFRAVATVVTVAWLAVLAAVLPGVARADTIDAINAARAAGCDRRAGLKSPFADNPKLAAAARRMARGASLRDALAGEDYLGLKSTSVRISGSPGNAKVGSIFRSRFCGILLDAQLGEMGLYREGRDLWFVLAQPFPVQALRNSGSVNQRILTLINEARSRPRRCGREGFAAAPPLTMSVKLSDAALAHSKDMAKRDYFEHEGKDGGTSADRVTRQGYQWRITGENIAAGLPTPEAAVQSWIDSPHHCANLMSPRFTQTGIGYAINPRSQMGIYWTQVFATPKLMRQS